MTREKYRKNNIYVLLYTHTKSSDITNSQESVFLHQLREDHVTRDKFIQFLAIQAEPGQFLVNDFNFWLEDERFKVYKTTCKNPLCLKVEQHIITQSTLSE